MSATHRPVPGLNAALDRQIETFFARMETGVVWTRDNVSYTRHADLNQHPSRRLSPLDAHVALEDLFVRIEHQSLLRLPESNSILFGIRIENVPMQMLRDLPNVAGRLAGLLATMSSDAAEYKGLLAVRERIVAGLHALEVTHIFTTPGRRSRPRSIAGCVVADGGCGIPACYGMWNASVLASAASHVGRSTSCRQEAGGRRRILKPDGLP